MNEMKIRREEILSLPMCYAVSELRTPQGALGVCASEGLGGCRVYAKDAPSRQTSVWENAGGCMSISQLEEDGTFLAVQNFFPGFDAKQAHLVKAKPDGEGWRVEPFMDTPYLHRFDVIHRQGRRFLVTCTLCGSKAFRDDWSAPGQVCVGELVNGTQSPARMESLIPALTKNHGFWHGTHGGREVLLIAGMEGLYEVAVPGGADGEWAAERLLNREISDATVVDIDGDGVEELVTIEGFHGDHVAVNKWVNDRWEIVYRCPAPFAHVVWGGNVLGKPGLLLAYRGDNGALMLLRKSSRQGGFYMDHTMIDELVCPTNFTVQSRKELCVIDAACAGTQKIMRYSLSL